MGHKGVSKRKPKKDNSHTNPNTPSKDTSPVQTLMKNNETAPIKDGQNPANNGFKPKNKKRNQKP
ncbi:MAG: hypothetical protein IPO22_07935 [Anaerolineales bacterium]|jgi:hypothetical protein|nr:hypothetical protein [Anaerolineales bacterium]